MMLNHLHHINKYNKHPSLHTLHTLFLIILFLHSLLLAIPPWPQLHFIHTHGPHINTLSPHTQGNMHKAHTLIKSLFQAGNQKLTPKMLQA